MKNNISSGLQVILRAVLYTIILTFLASLFVFVYDSCQSIALKGHMIGFNFKGALVFIMTFLPFGMQMSTLFLIFYFIRHPTFKVFPIAMFVVMFLAFFFALSPLSVKARNAIYLNNSESVVLPLSQNGDFAPELGIFKKQESKVFYFTRIYDSGDTEGLVIDLASGNSKPQVFDLSDQSEATRSMRDSLVEDAVRVPDATSFLLDRFIDYFELENAALNGGWPLWISFAFMAAALCALVGLRNVSEWRLMTFILVVVLFFGIVTLNYFAWSADSFLSGLVEKTASGALGKIPFIQNPFAILMNLVIMLLLTALGILFNKKAKLRLQEVGE